MEKFSRSFSLNQAKKKGILIWIKEVQLDKDVGGIRATDVTQI
ncbi:MAG: hypothetical protein ACH349_03225 [Candidatus Rhabdochlamydia sp.]